MQKNSTLRSMVLAIAGMANLGRKINVLDKPAIVPSNSFVPAPVYRLAFPLSKRSFSKRTRSKNMLHVSKATKQKHRRAR